MHMLHDSREGVDPKYWRKQSCFDAGLEDVWKLIEAPSHFVIDIMGLILLQLLLEKVKPFFVDEEELK